ncbi:sorting nexin-29-like isoform X1 [Haliotis rufescens]|uniref:sorting nexin-29-like isoform X1 n=1 Tax=Haliotis rufescens TaxID=6454 RepID=UPI00201F25AD|nr:sorting nexin-29-like isoform X1 [Haliotis rufescens]
MNGDDCHFTERQNLLTRLLDAVKQCQVRFGGRSELATDADSRVSCLCAAWEAALQHGMRKNNKALSAIKQVTERAGLSKVTDFLNDIKNIDPEPAFWQYAKEVLTKHELQRFANLKTINTDAGRGRAWLRASFNEHSLERYMHMFIDSEDMLSQFYEEWAFLRDQERSSMLPMMSAGLGSILFAITIDRPELNRAHHLSNNVHVNNTADHGSAPDIQEEPHAVIAGDNEIAESAKKKEKKKKKKIANIVSFDEDDADVFSESGSVTAKSRKSPHSSVSSDPISREDSIKDMSDNMEDKTGVQMRNGDPGDGFSSKGGNSGQSNKAAPIVSQTSSDGLSRSSLGSFSSEDVELGESTATLTPLSRSGQPIDLTPPSGRNSSQSQSVDSEVLGYTGEEVESAALALAMVQKGLNQSPRTQGDGGSIDEVLEQQGISGQSMCHTTSSIALPSSPKTAAEKSDLKQAVVAMMLRKDEVEEQNKSVKAMLEHEMETSSMLRAEIEELKLQQQSRQEMDLAKIQALQKENELLKHQLRKYVNAVQLLRTEAVNKDANLGVSLEDPQPTIPPEKPMIDYSYEASEYEKKLIQVAEMHGELMEFNELLHRQLNSKETLLKQLRQELVNLRGPLPYDSQASIEDSLPGDTDALALTRTLVNIWIPSAFIRGTATDSHHVYQIYVRIRDEEWNVYRRYSQFHDLHVKLKKLYPLVSKYEFPPKKTIGSKDAKVVEVRRQSLQKYLRRMINLLMEKNEQFVASVTKETLMTTLPFFNDQDEGSKRGRKGKPVIPKRSAQPPAPVPSQQQLQQGATSSSSQGAGL